MAVFWVWGLRWDKPLCWGTNVWTKTSASWPEMRQRKRKGWGASNFLEVSRGPPTSWPQWCTVDKPGSCGHPGNRLCQQSLLPHLQWFLDHRHLTLVEAHSNVHFTKHPKWFSTLLTESTSHSWFGYGSRELEKMTVLCENTNNRSLC